MKLEISQFWLRHPPTMSCMCVLDGVVHGDGGGALLKMNKLKTGKRCWVVKCHRTKLKCLNFHSNFLKSNFKCEISRREIRRFRAILISFFSHFNKRWQSIVSHSSVLHKSISEVKLHQNYKQFCIL